MWERRCLRHHVLRVAQVEEESTHGVFYPKSQPQSPGVFYASDTRSVASRGLQNMTPVRRLRIRRVACLNPLANPETDRVVGVRLQGDMEKMMRLAPCMGRF